MCSAQQNLLVVPLCKEQTSGDRAHAVAAPRLWNSLPVQIQTAQSIELFKSQLKTHLFALAFDTS